VALGAAGAGLLAHSMYLWAQAGRDGAPLSSWYHWCLLAAWVLAVFYLVMLVRRPASSIGIFVLPLVLGLIGMAYLVRDAAPYPLSEARSYWSTIHGAALLMGTVSVVIGFAAGLMFLVQSYRLKHKLPPSRGFHLPSLEWLQRINERSVLLSAFLLLVGLISGIVLNLIKHRARAEAAVPWTDPVVVTSGVLFAWLVAATIFNYAYRPARMGRKVAYLTLANFVFLLLALSMVLFGPSEHTGPGRQQARQATERAERAPKFDLARREVGP